MRKDMSFKVKRTEAVNTAAGILSEFIKGLPLSQPDNDKLISLIVDQVNMAEHDAYLQGFDFALKIT